MLKVAASNTEDNTFRSLPDGHTFEFTPKANITFEGDMCVNVDAMGRVDFSIWAGDQNMSAELSRADAIQLCRDLLSVLAPESETGPQTA